MDGSRWWSAKYICRSYAYICRSTTWHSASMGDTTGLEARFAHECFPFSCMQICTFQRMAPCNLRVAIQGQQTWSWPHQAAGHLSFCQVGGGCIVTSLVFILLTSWIPLKSKKKSSNDHCLTYFCNQDLMHFLSTLAHPQRVVPYQGGRAL